MYKHILLIDEDREEHMIFKDSLNTYGEGLVLLDAYSCKEAFQILYHVTPDVILLDLDFPGEDGLSFLLELKSTVNTRSIPVYMYSTMISNASRSKALQYGAEGCLQKWHDQQHPSEKIADILNEKS